MDGTIEFCFTDVCLMVVESRFDNKPIFRCHLDILENSHSKIIVNLRVTRDKDLELHKNSFSVDNSLTLKMYLPGVNVYIYFFFTEPDLLISDKRNSHQIISTLLGKLIK